MKPLSDFFRIGSELFDDDIHPSGHIGRATHVNVWIWIAFFNYGTRPSGYISCSTKVDVFRSCFRSLNRLIKPNYIVQVWGLVKFEIIASDRG